MIPRFSLIHFQRIHILHATIFRVPKHLASVYPSLDGCAQTAGIKIQLEYDLHSGQFLNFQVEPGRNNDKITGFTEYQLATKYMLKKADGSFVHQMIK